MVALVTLAQVRSMLRIGEIDDSPMPAFEDDAILENVYIPAASLAVTGYLKGQADTVIPGLADSPQTAEGCPEDVQIATIILIGMIYREPDGDEAKNFGHGKLPDMVTSLLYRYRDPALA